MNRKELFPMPQMKGFIFDFFWFEFTISCSSRDGVQCGKHKPTQGEVKQRVLASSIGIALFGLIGTM